MSQRSTQRWIQGWMAWLLLPALALSVGACSDTIPAPAPAAALPLPAATPLGTAALSAVAATYTAVGTVEARTSAVMAARMSGYVTAVHVHAGDRVRAGQVLVELAAPEAHQQVAAAQAGTAADTAGVEAAQRQTAAAQAQADLAHATFQRYQQMRKADAVSPHEFDQAEAADRSAAAALAAAEAQSQAASARLRQAEAGLDQARAQAGYATLTAPFAAVVTSKSVAVGDLATPGAPLLELEVPGDFLLAVSVPDQYLAALRTGQMVEASVAGHDHASFSTRIVEIAPVSDASARAAIVKVALPDAAGLRTGLYGEVRLPSPGASARLLVPAAAVLGAGELDEMYVAAGGPARSAGAELRLVTTGAAAGGQVEILSGLAPGERYVLNASAFADATRNRHGQ